MRKHQALDSDTKAIQQINLTENLQREWNTAIFFIFEEVKEDILDFSYRTVILLWIYFALQRHHYKMTHPNSVKVKLSNPELNKLKSATKNETGSSNMIIIKYV